MRKFIIRTLFFVLPPLLILIAVEVAIRNTPNTFSRKAAYLKENLSEIQVLCLGSSHSQDGIDPALFHVKGANLAFGGQDLHVDSALFFTYVHQMPRLRYVVLELDYHTLETRMESDNYRIPWYYIYHGIELQKLPASKKVSLFFSSPTFFTGYLFLMTQPRMRQLQINEHGFITNDHDGYFKKRHFDSSSINQEFHQRLGARHGEEDLRVYAENIRKLNGMLSYCRDNNIKVLVITTPAYQTYRQNQKPDKRGRVQCYADSLRLLPFVTYRNFEAAPEFLITDFKNDDHLSREGSIKLTQLLDQELQAADEIRNP